MSAQNVELEAKVFEIAKELRCPVCVSESVADSNADISIEMREIIQSQLEEGKSKPDILAFFQARYGDWILLSPPKRGLHLLVWLLPLIAGLIGLSVLALVIRRWMLKAQKVEAVDEADLRRVRDALKQGS